ncbi:hypothetical protein [Stackebrandtia albiflava]|nr:hypothetical protein [Stackebrandtia albiflava]
MEHHEKAPDPDEERHRSEPARESDRRADALRDDLVEEDKSIPLPEDERPGYPDPDRRQPNPETHRTPRR